MQLQYAACSPHVQFKSQVKISKILSSLGLKTLNKIHHHRVLEVTPAFTLPAWLVSNSCPRTFEHSRQDGYCQGVVAK